MSNIKNIEILNFFTALLILLQKSTVDFVNKELALEYNKNLKKLEKILNYDFKNFAIGEKELYLEEDLIQMPIDGFSNSSAGNKENPALEKKYKKDWLILKLNQLILTIGDLNKKI